MAYTSHAPSQSLAAYIDDFFYVDGPAFCQRLKIFPMPSQYVIVNLGEPIHVYGLDRTGLISTCTESCWAGLWSSCHIVDWPPNARVFGVHFKLAGAAPFLRLPLSELHDQVISLDAIWGRDAAIIRERLYDSSIEEGFALLDDFFRSKLCEPLRGLDIVQFAVGEIARPHGELSIQILSDRIGISQNHLKNQFKRTIGVSPKKLARVYRFAHLLDAIEPSRPVDWVLVAHQAGYYDQSHFNKEFAAFTGVTPTTYLRQRRGPGMRQLAPLDTIGQLLVD